MLLSLTRQERMVLCLLALIVFCGSTIHYLLKKYPAVKNVLSLIENEALYKKIDINKASVEQFESLPLIGKITAERIVAYRDQLGCFETVEQLKNVPGIGDISYQRILPYLRKIK